MLTIVLHAPVCLPCSHRKQREEAQQRREQQDARRLEEQKQQQQRRLEAPPDSDRDRDRSWRADAPDRRYPSGDRWDPAAAAAAGPAGRGGAGGHDRWRVQGGYTRDERGEWRREEGYYTRGDAPPDRYNPDASDDEEPNREEDLKASRRTSGGRDSGGQRQREKEEGSKGKKSRGGGRRHDSSSGGSSSTSGSSGSSSGTTSSGTSSDSGDSRGGRQAAVKRGRDGAAAAGGVPSTDERPRKRQEREGDVQRLEGVRGGGHPDEGRLPRYDDRWVTRVVWGLFPVPQGQSGSRIAAVAGFTASSGGLVD